MNVKLVGKLNFKEETLMYDYVDAVKNDIRDYIEENLEYYEIDEDTTLMK